MSLEKQVTIDKIEVLEQGQIQVRQITRIIEDGKELSASYHRWAIVPTDDISAQDSKVQAVANAVWTDEVKNAYKAMIEAQQAQQHIQQTQGTT